MNLRSDLAAAKKIIRTFAPLRQQRAYLLLVFIVCFISAALQQLGVSESPLTIFNSANVSHGYLTDGGISDSEAELKIEQLGTEKETQEIRIKTRIKASEINFYPEAIFESAFTQIASEESLLFIREIVLPNSLLVVSPLRGPPFIA